MYNFPEKFLEEIKTSIDQALDDGAEPLAAFDADGTLWATDMGDNMFRYQFMNKLIPNMPEDPWQYYLEMSKKDPEKGFLWLAQINSGKSLEQVQKWASEAYKLNHNVGLFSGQKEVINHLQKKGVEVFIVTASVKWAVEPAAKVFNVDADHVIGVVTQVENGTVTEEQGGPVTWREGKVKGLLEATQGRHAFFAAGNTGGDLPLLESSTHLRLVLASADKDHENRETEQKMQALAKENHWLAYDFTNQ